MGFDFLLVAPSLAAIYIASLHYAFKQKVHDDTRVKTPTPEEIARYQERLDALEASTNALLINTGLRSNE